MEKEREKIKEPFDPEETPKPPQQIDPDTQRKRENPVSEKRRGPAKPEDERTNKSEGGHLLDEQADIDDETTI